jgi:hypothetical protein
VKAGISSIEMETFFASSRDIFVAQPEKKISVRRAKMKKFNSFLLIVICDPPIRFCDLYFEKFGWLDQVLLILSHFKSKSHFNILYIIADYFLVEGILFIYN